MIVLLVDDDPVCRRLLRRLLTRFPEIEVREADDGQAAWSMLGDVMPAVIFCDLQMPVMDGATLIRKIREHPTFGPIPIIVTSASKDRELLLALKDMQLLDYLLKPFDLVQTFARLEKHFAPLLRKFRADKAAAAAPPAAPPPPPAPPADQPAA